MPMLPSYRGLRALFVISTFVLSSIATSQELQQYNGPLRAGAYEGLAAYSYRIIDGDTLLQGPFRMNRSNLGALLDDGDATVSISGGFDVGKPAGNWSFGFGEFETDSLSEMVGLRYAVNIHGRQFEASGSMIDGKPSGQWIQQVAEIQNSELARTLFRSSFEFVAGIPQQSFRIEGSGNVLLGRVLRNGLAHDSWTVYPETGSRASETWVFDEGVLVRVELNTGSAAAGYSIFESTFDKAKIVDLDQSFLELVSILHPELGVSQVAVLLARNATYYQNLDDFFDDLSQADFKPGIRVRVPYRDLQAGELGQWETLDSLVAGASGRVAELLGDTQLNLIRRTDEQAQFLYAATDSLDNRFVKPLAQCLRPFRGGYLEFLPDQSYIHGILANMETSPRIAIPVTPGSGTEQRVFSGPGANQVNTNGRDLDAAISQARYAAASLDSIRDVLAEKLQLHQDREALRELENELVLAGDSLNRAIDSLGKGASPAVVETLEAIRVQAEQLLANYAAAPESDKKDQGAGDLKDCIEGLWKLAHAVGAVPGQTGAIENAYTDQIWNPFMATVMNESIKKRLTSAYRDILIPYALKAIRDNPDCNRTDRWEGFLKHLYNRMLEYRDEDTRKLERRLKRERDPLVVIGLFDLENPMNLD